MNNPIKNSEQVIVVESVWKSFEGGRIPVLKDVTLSAGKGEIVALWGASGSGKTTLLHLLGGLDVADRGNIRVAGLNPTSSQDRLRLRREKVGFVFQLHNLIPNLSLAENCLVPILAAGGSVSAAAIRLEDLARKLGFTHRLKQHIQKLSGGERQRAAVCRALIHNPGIILADEPTGSLDEKNGEEVFSLLKSLTRSDGITVIMATHERRFAEACDRIFHVQDGHFEEVRRNAG